MPTAYVKNNILHVEIELDRKGRPTTSKRNLLHASTEDGLNGLSCMYDGKKLYIQLHAFTER